MVGQSSAMFGWSWTEVNVLVSQVFGQAVMESCALSDKTIRQNYQTELSDRTIIQNYQT